MDYQKLVQLFEENSDEKYNSFNSKIINSGVQTIGCTVPFVRKVAKKYIDNLEEVVKLPTHRYYEVDLLKGIAIASSKLPFAEKAPYLTAFSQTVENWAVCDCSVVKVSDAEKDKYFPFFCEMAKSHEPFVARYGVVNLLWNFLQEQYIGKVFETLDSVVTYGNYYVDMGVAWLVATAMVHCRAATVKFMENEGRTVLNEFAYNKALQKMRDSFRVSAADKLWTRTLKL